MISMRLDIERIAGLGEGLADVDRLAVHVLDGDRDDAGADDVGDRLAGLGDLAETEQHGTCSLRLPEDADGDLRHHPELALGADDEADQVIAGGIESAAADLDDLALHGHQLQPENVVGGDAILQAMGAAGVHRDIAGDGAGELARRVRRVEETGMGDLAGDRQIGDAGLHPHGAIGEIDVQHAVHLGDAEHNGVLLRDRATAERGAGAARHHRHALGVAEGEDGRDLLRRLGQDDNHRQPSIGGQRVGLEGTPLVLFGDHALAGDDGPERGDDAVALRQHVAARRGKGNGHGVLPVPASPSRLE